MVVKDSVFGGANGGKFAEEIRKKHVIHTILRLITRNWDTQCLYEALSNCINLGVPTCIVCFIGFNRLDDYTLFEYILYLRFFF